MPDPVTITLLGRPVPGDRPLATFSDQLRPPQRVSDRALVESYRRLGNVHSVGKELGIGGGSAHERLVRLGEARPINVFTDLEDERLRSEYWIAAEAGKLNELAIDMGRLKTTICTRARALGLTKRDRAKPYGAVWKYVGEEHAREILENFKKSGKDLNQYCKSKKYNADAFSMCMRRHFPDEWEHVIESKQISQTKYKIGRQLEYRVRDHLKSLGYFALRSPASKSPVDIVAIRPYQVLLVQCKRGGNLGVSEWNEIFDLAVSCGAIPILASCPTGRGTLYEHLVGRKDGSKRSQPKKIWMFEPGAVA